MTFPREDRGERDPADARRVGAALPVEVFKEFPPPLENVLLAKRTFWYEQAFL